ncbi:acetyltransferase [Novosphingobium barchaimii LL02]|uniref:Acetyltransferase n=1 Tax=Novosphingobium barchaimii LL02 TaxID=1114963 RepID=A0A0J7XL96_9SPHN|nr:GNAT family N-acetyltransferase [Novosphingobium barchaimii]KMS52766.1 acetyltransferase [Novosphingobium barchaimii LL02]
MSGKPILTTQRLELYRPAPGDLPGLCRLIADEETRRYLGPASADPQPQFERLLRNAGSWALYGYGSFMVRFRGEGEIIASGGIFHSYRGYGEALGLDDVPEAGWIVRADHCGQGIAGEVMEAVLSWFDEAHGSRRIACMIEDGNTASQRLAAKLGFAHYGAHEVTDGPVPVVLGLYERLRP